MNKEIFTLPDFSSLETKNENLADELTFTVRSWATGTTLTSNATLVIQLMQYPLSVPANLALNITYRECFPDNFKGPEIDALKMQVGDDVE